MLPMSSPLRCTSPADVYLLLKSSDFISHDLDPEITFQHCEERPQAYELELVLRRWYPVDRVREFRCFVRQEVLLGMRPSFPPPADSDHSYLGICQRDPNYYPFLNEHDMERRITGAISQVWEENVKGKWEVTRGNCQSTKILPVFIRKSHTDSRYVRCPADKRPQEVSCSRLQSLCSQHGLAFIHIRRIAHIIRRHLVWGLAPDTSRL